MSCPATSQGQQLTSGLADSQRGTAAFGLQGTRGAPGGWGQRGGGENQATSAAQGEARVDIPRSLRSAWKGHPHWLNSTKGEGQPAGQPAGNQGAQRFT